MRETSRDLQQQAPSASRVVWTRFLLRTAIYLAVMHDPAGLLLKAILRSGR
ncbi:MAG: hypothetical protein JXP73_08560 [Deltaproteobacteria bacterium]|jgi:hypothetical protein|nr:hypothetical protein [Deltaproteobacteria bacterium]